MVSDEVVRKLAVESKRRIDASSEFAEVQTKLAKERENRGLIRLADLAERREEDRQKKQDADSPEKDDSAASDEVEDDEEEITPQLAEATNVLVDLIAMNTPTRTRTTGVNVP